VAELMVSLCSEFEVSSLTRCKGRKTTQNLQNGQGHWNMVLFSRSHTTSY